MKKYILLILLFLMSNVSAKAIFDDYRIEVEVNNNHYTVKEKFKVEYNDSYDITYAKIIDNAKYSNVESNLDEFMIDENDYVTFYLTTGKEYYINYDSVYNDFMVSGSQGRIAELFGVTASFKENTFKAHLSETAGNNQPLFVNKATKLTQEKNEIQGF